MPIKDVLDQDEIDALLGGVGGDINEEIQEEIGGIRSYDFASQERIVRGRMPTLDLINERFARSLRISLYTFLRHSSMLSVVGVKILKYGEYIHTLLVPTSINMVRMRPLRGTALIVMDSRLVFMIVENFFGGTGRYYTKLDGRDFTPTENRIISRVLDLAFKDLEEAWKAVMPVKFEFQDTEANPAMANIVSPNEMVVVSQFYVELEGGGGHIHIAIPYSMLEPIRELLDAGLQSDRDEIDERWETALKEEVLDAPITLHSKLAETELKIREIINMQVGDVIPIDIPNQLTVFAENVPVFKAQVGTSNGFAALKIDEVIERPEEYKSSTPGSDQHGLGGKDE